MTSVERTLGYLSIHPLRQQYDLSTLPVATVGQTVRAYMKEHEGNNMASPDQQAVAFYAFSQMLAILATKYDRCEPLSDDDYKVLDLYLRWVQKEGVRAAIYLLIIIIRECRHTHADAVKDDKIGSQVSHAAVKWIRQYKSGENYTSLWQDPPKCSFGELVTVIRRFFYEQSYSGGYGGPKWGGISDCLESYVYGRTSAEIMLDTNWTLSHNNGPIFNKGMLYNMYDHKLKTILDIQRGGMILQGILESHKAINYAVPGWLGTLTTSFYERHKEAIGEPYIDWYAVEALGAIQSCQQYQKMQVDKYGANSPMAQKIEAIKLQKQLEKEKLQALAVEKAAKEEAEFLKTHYIVDTKLTLKKFEKNRAA